MGAQLDLIFSSFLAGHSDGRYYLDYTKKLTKKTSQKGSQRTTMPLRDGVPR